MPTDESGEPETIWMHVDDTRRSESALADSARSEAFRELRVSTGYSGTIRESQVSEPVRRAADAGLGHHRERWGFFDDLPPAPEFHNSEPHREPWRGVPEDTRDALLFWM